MRRAIHPIELNISDGDEGIYETVNYMWHYALRDSHSAEIKELVSSLKSKNPLQTLKNIYTWVTDNISYELDPPNYEMITAPIHFVNENRYTGDCDCMTTLLVCLLETAGFESAITVIAWRVWDYTHVFAEVKYNSNWYVLDPTLGNAGFGKQDKKIKRFKKITKKNMPKLVVLADGQRNAAPNNFKSAIRRNRRHCEGSHCRNRDDNENINNININFGTSVEGSYNHARPVATLPFSQNNSPQRHKDTQRQSRNHIILQPDTQGGYNRKPTNTNNPTSATSTEKPANTTTANPKPKKYYIEFP